MRNLIATVFTVCVIAVSTVASGPAQSLDERSLQNLVAFTRAYGYVRYFHPSSELNAAGLSAYANWTEFVCHGIKAVEPAHDANHLAESLRKFFAPYAPGVRFEVDDARADADVIVPPPDAPAPTHAIYWHHLGHGRTDQAAYISTRKVVHLDQFDHEEFAPKPGTALMRDLGGGIIAHVPICLWGDEKQTFPPAQAEAAKPNYAAPTDSRTMHLAAAIVAWNVFQHFYPYFDVVPNDWDGALEEVLREAAAADSDAAFGRALQRMVAKLHDGHGVVVHPSMPRTHTLPLSLALVESKLIVSAVAESMREQIMVGDIIRSFDTKPADEVLKQLALHTSTSTPQHMRFRLTQELIIGGEGRVDLELERADGSIVTARISRVPRDSGRSVEAWREPRPQTISQIRPGIWYVNLDVITPDEFHDALPKLSKADGIVFDLRGYPRQIFVLPIQHHIDEPTRSANWRIPIITYPDHQHMAFHKSFWPLPPAEPKLPKNIAYITDGRAVSAAETYLAIVRELGIDIVGEATAGTNGNINPIDLPGGYRVIWTGMKVLKHDESQHHGVGIPPTHPVQRTIAGVRAGKDELLDAALDLVQSRVTNPEN